MDINITFDEGINRGLHIWCELFDYRLSFCVEDNKFSIVMEQLIHALNTNTDSYIPCIGHIVNMEINKGFIIFNLDHDQVAYSHFKLPLDKYKDKFIELFTSILKHIEE